MFVIVDVPGLNLLPLWPILFTVIWAIWNATRDSRDEKLVERSLAWPEAQGIVVSSRVVWAHVEVKYEYVVSSGRYTGKYKMNLPPSPPDKYARTVTRANAEAKLDIAEYPPDSKVIVRYNPQRPSQSVLYCKGEVDRNSANQAVVTPPKLFTLN